MSWRRLGTLIRREVLATFRDPFTLIVLITVPLAALLLFGFVLSTEVKHLTLGVVDGDRSATSRRFVADLAANGTFDPMAYPTRAALEHALVSGSIGVGIIIPPDLDRDLRTTAPGRAPPNVQVLYDGGEAVLAGNAEGFLRGLMAATALRVDAHAHPSERQPTAPHSSGVAVVTRALFNPRLDGKPFMVAGTFGFVLSFLTVLITAVSIVNEKLGGTFEQLQVTPATGLEILLGKILPLGAVLRSMWR